MTVLHQRILLFIAYASISLIVSIMSTVAGHESAFAPMCIFYPWVRLLIEYGTLPETKLSIVPCASAYIFLLFLAGSLAVKLSRLKLFLFVLLVHLLGISLNMILIHHDMLSVKRLATWGYTISIPMSFGYYFYDFKLLKEMHVGTTPSSG